MPFSRAGGWGSQASDFYILQAAAAFKDPKSAHELYHEIGHSWNAKTKPEVKRTRWFDEAFAAYFEALFFKEWIVGAESSELLIGNASVQEIVERYRAAGERN